MNVNDANLLLKLAGSGHVAVLEVMPPTRDQPLALRVERIQQLDGLPLWAVRQGGSVLARDGRWEHEPLPSSRTGDFLQRCRFCTLTEAWTAAMAAQ